MRILVTALVLTLASVAAIAGRNTPHDPAKFTEYTSALRFVLTADFTYTERRGIGVKIEQGLRAGTYEPRYQDDEGYYFVGPQLALCQKNPKCTGFDSEGGIWVSKKSNEDIRLFLVQGHPKSDPSNAYQTNSTIQNAQRAGAVAGGVGSAIGWSLVETLAARDDGKIFLFPLNKEFAAKMAESRTGGVG